MKFFQQLRCASLKSMLWILQNFQFFFLYFGNVLGAKIFLFTPHIDDKS